MIVAVLGPAWPTMFKYYVLSSVQVNRLCLKCELYWSILPNIEVKQIYLPMEILCIFY